MERGAMIRLDVFEPDENDYGGEKLVAGIVFHDGKLKWCDGDENVVRGLLNDVITIPGPSGEILKVRATIDPETWIQWAPGRASSPYQRVGEPYDDYDELYDPEDGRVHRRREREAAELIGLEWARLLLSCLFIDA